MKLIYCSIIGLYLLSVPVFAQDQQEDKSYLKMFTEDEQCIILAFENQLGQFIDLYNASTLKGSLNLMTTVKLSDVAYLFYDYKTNNSNISLQGFFKYLWKVDEEGHYNAIENKYTNFENDILNFEQKVRINYNGIKAQKQEDFTKRLLDIPEVKLFIQELLNRYPEEFERR